MALQHFFQLPRLSLRFIPVWRRNYMVWKKLAIPSILGNLADPMLYMLGLGYGLAACFRRYQAYLTSPSSPLARWPIAP